MTTVLIVGIIITIAIVYNNNKHTKELNKMIKYQESKWNKNEK
mgnify:CR=1 FL=1